MPEPIDLTARDEEDRRIRELQAKAAADYARAQSARNAAEVRARQAEARIAGNDAGSSL